MITNKELGEVTLSPTKKDYYQIWNELMELADKISARWSPASTNESDPGIVLLKALTAVADKLNYNIDKNTLEAFMPSATQEDSMRKLTEMMGYDMKYYRSATGKAAISYKNSITPTLSEFGQEGIYFPAFINLKNEEEDINYVTLREFRLSMNVPTQDVEIIEGELLECATNNDNIISILHLDDQHRYILPEASIAENGIFITNISDSAESNYWKKEQNLNVQLPGAKVYKFGFDSKTRLPYIQFPDDISALIGDGIKIKYIRTNGLSGNIPAKQLTKLEKPAIWSSATESKINNLSADSFVVANAGACINGADPESLDAAYANYKKTIGTFETLVTCRDYMNKIYQMTESDINTTPLVSNVIVSDIRDDINKSTPVCSFNAHGITYTDMSLKDRTGEDKIEHFDLVIYPFKTIYGLNNKNEFKNSFKYTGENLHKISADLATNKTIAHNIISPNSEDLACIKNYLKLKAKITTTKKVTASEENEILKNVYTALYTNFNARYVDFGEEIPYENLLKVIKNADPRIKDVNLDEPTLQTAFCRADSYKDELWLTTSSNDEAVNSIYNQLALRNVLAGKISAFEYDKDFKSDYDKTGYYTTANENTIENIDKLESCFNVTEAWRRKGDSESGLKLLENEVIQFRVPNFKTVTTYPAYVNYYINLNTAAMVGEGAIPATFQLLGDFMGNGDTDVSKTRWEDLANSTQIYSRLKAITIEDETTFTSNKTTYVVLFKKSTLDNKFELVTNFESTNTEYYYLPLNDSCFVAFDSWIKEQIGNHGGKLYGIYRSSGVQSNPAGQLIDVNLYKYLRAHKFNVDHKLESKNSEVLTSFYVQRTYSQSNSTPGECVGVDVTADGCGKDASYRSMPKNGEYELGENEWLFINYTNTTTDPNNGQEIKTVVNKPYGQGTIIKTNFDIMDSALYHNSHSYSKRDGFYFENRPTLEGMFTLGTDEQIEIREQVKITLNDAGAHLYWILKSDDPDKDQNKFIFDEDYGLNAEREDTNGDKWAEDEHNAYTLKEGEYLFYTKSNKQDLAYYGAGSLIVRGRNTQDLVKYAQSGEISVEEIITNGLAAEIPWEICQLNGSKAGLHVIENQYISLTEGDTIIDIDNNSPNLTNRWSTVRTATYQFAEEQTVSHLPAINITNGNISWEARSRLDFNMSQTSAQVLHWGDELELTFKNPSSNTPKTLKIAMADAEPTEVDPMWVNSNYRCMAAIDTYDVSAVGDFKLKLSKQVTPTVAGTPNKLSLNNYVNGTTYYTKFDFDSLPADYTDGNPAFTLNVNIPATKTGLLMIYYVKGETAGATPAYIKSILLTGQESEGICLYNKESITNYNSKLNLNEGINIIEVASNIATLEFYPDTNKQSTIIFGTLDIINDINPKLDYRVASTETISKLNKLLSDIRNSGVADEFYYNVPITNTNSIDLNPLIETETLSSPHSWYDPNNVNRKFVISEIDADYLSTGITLTKSSRL